VAEIEAELAEAEAAADKAAGIHRLSATQLKMFHCPRAWAAKYLIKIPVYPTPDMLKARLFGSRLHKYAENYSKTGEMPPSEDPAGALLLKGLHLVPAPGSGKLPEHRERFTFGGFSFVVVVDVLSEESIEDYKTSADPKKYGLSAKTLPDDEQAILYAVFFTHHYSPTDDGPRCVAELKWHYFPKRSGQPFTVRYEMGRKEAAEKFRLRVLPAATKMQAMRKAWEQHGSSDINPVRAMNCIPNNPSACDGVGRMCDYAQFCKIY
jgi:hypothetical protein